MHPTYQPAPLSFDPLEGLPRMDAADAKRSPKASTLIRRFEGPRGQATRAAVLLRHVAYLLAVVICSGVTHWAFQTNAAWRSGGLVMLFTAAFMFAVAAIGTVLYGNNRNEIIQQCRHFVFGIAVFPGTGIALFMRGVQGVLSGPASAEDAFANILRGSALPLVFFATVCIPAAVFVKYVAGIRTMHRSRLDDQEMIAMWSRQDGMQI